MLTKGLILILAVTVALWAAGVDVRSLKDSVLGTSSDTAKSLTGPGDDWA